MKLDYETARGLIERGRSGRKKLANNTYLERTGEDSISVKLHNTYIIDFREDGSIILDSEGWRTVTTKARMNEFAPVSVWSDRGTWYVSRYVPQINRSVTAVFADGIRVYPDGRFEGAGKETESKIRAWVLKEIRRYVKGYAEHVRENGLELPSGGDCWGCAMREAAARSKPQAQNPWREHPEHAPGGDHVMGLDHILSHFDEGYYVPSLLGRAVERRAGNPGVVWASMKADAERGRTGYMEMILRGYLRTLVTGLVALKVSAPENISREP